MLILDSTLKSIELILSGVVTANQLPFVVSYIDVTSTTYIPNSNDGVSNNAVAVTAIAAPIASTQRQVKLITIHNADTVSATVTLRLNNNGTFRTICKVVLSTLSQLVYTDGEGFRVIDQNGGVVQGNNVISLTSQVSGILPVVNGGTGVASLSNILGTTNQVSISGGTARIIGGNATLSLPQDIHTGANAQFNSLALGGAPTAFKLDVNDYARITSNTANVDALSLIGSSTTGQSYGFLVRGGTNSSDAAFRIYNQAGTLPFLFVQGNGNIGIGTTTPATSALLELASTIGALLITRLTTTQKNALTPVNGMIVYDSTLGKFQGYEAGAWNNFSVL